jgi:hypothetical protein
MFVTAALSFFLASAAPKLPEHPHESGPRAQLVSDHAVTTNLCGAQGLNAEAGALDTAQQKNFAKVCAAYHLGAYEISGSTSHLDVVMLYARQYGLTVQDIDNVTWPNPQTSTFNADMTKIGKVMEQLTQAERQQRLDMWSKVASGYFSQSFQKNQQVLPYNMLALARELKKSRFAAH